MSAPLLDGSALSPDVFLDAYDAVTVEEVVGDDDDQEVAFIKTTKFEGQKPGYTFGTGQHGTGYYLDGHEGTTYLDVKPRHVDGQDGQQKRVRRRED